MDDIRELERETQLALQEKYQEEGNTISYLFTYIIA